MSQVVNYYIYIHRTAKQQRAVGTINAIENGIYIYDRTVSTRERAVERVRELKAQGNCTAVYLVNHTINGAFY